MDNPVLITIVVVLIVYSGFELFKKKNENLLLYYFQSKEFDECLKLLDSFGTKLTTSIYSREYFRLNIYLAQGNNKKIKNQLNKLLNARVDKQSRKKIIEKAFNYYLQTNNKEKCKELIKLSKGDLDDAFVNKLVESYDIFLLKNGVHIKEMLAAYETSDNTEKAILAYLLSVQYGNINDQKNEKKYNDIYLSYAKTVSS